MLSGVAVHSINDAKNPGLLYSPYIHFVDEITKYRLSAGKDPSAFFIGGGGYFFHSSLRDTGHDVICYRGNYNPYFNNGGQSSITIQNGFRP